MGILSSLLAMTALTGQGVTSDALRKQATELAGILGDPRNSRYCRVSIESPGDPKHPFEAWGFVNEMDPKSAVLWDGLRYPILKIAGPARIDDALKLLSSKNDSFVGPNWSTRTLGPLLAKSNYPQTLVNPGAITLLAMLDRDALATALADKVQLDSGGNALKSWLADRYRVRFLDLFTNGRDKEALATIEIEAVLAKKFGIRSKVARANPFEELRADVRRRLEEPKTSLEGEAKLIRELEEIRVFAFSPESDPKLAAAIQAGPSIVPAMIAVFNNDTRLTRARVPSRNFPDESIAPVSLGAKVVIESLWPESMYYWTLPEDKLQAVFARQRYLPRPFRLAEVVLETERSDAEVISALGEFSNRAPRSRDERLGFARVIIERGEQIQLAIDRRIDKLFQLLKDDPKDRTLETIDRFATALADFDYERGGRQLRRAVSETMAILDRPLPGGSNSRSMLGGLFDVGLANDDAQVGDAYLQYTRRPDHLDKLPYILWPAILNPQLYQSNIVLAEIGREIAEIWAAPANPARGIRIAEMLKQTDLDIFAKPQVIRKALIAGLSNESSVMAVWRFGRFQVPLDWGGPASLDLPGKDGDRLLVSVADYLANVIEPHLKAGFSITASTTKKKVAKEAMIAKLRAE